MAEHTLTQEPDEQHYGDGLDVWHCSCGEQFGPTEIDSAYQHGYKTGATPMGLPFGQAGQVVQSLAQVLVDRGYERSEIVWRLAAWAPHNEQVFWERVAATVDGLAQELGIPSYPPDADTD